MSSDIQFSLSLILVGGKDAEEFRNVRVTPRDPVILGRASKDATKALNPEVSNLWLNSPVISRHHARFSCSNAADGSPVVYIEDLKSSHGTFLVRGEKRCEPGELYKITDGDILRFGAKVTRGADEFQPPIFKITLTKSSVSTPPASSLPTPPTPGNTYTVPSEAESDSEMEEDDVHSVHSVASSDASVQEIDNPFLARRASPTYSPRSPIWRSENRGQSRVLVTAPIPALDMVEDSAYSPPPATHYQGLHPTPPAQDSDDAVSSSEDDLSCYGYDMDEEEVQDELDAEEEQQLDDLPALTTMPGPFNPYLPELSNENFAREFPPFAYPTSSYSSFKPPQVIITQQVPNMMPHGLRVQVPYESPPAMYTQSKRMDITNLISRESPSEVSSSKKRAHSEILDDPLEFDFGKVTKTTKDLLGEITQAGASPTTDSTPRNDDTASVTAVPEAAAIIPTSQVAEAERPRKRSRVKAVAKGLGYFVAGGVVTVATLLALPDLA